MGLFPQRDVRNREPPTLHQTTGMEDREPPCQETLPLFRGMNLKEQPASLGSPVLFPPAPGFVAGTRRRQRHPSSRQDPTHLSSGLRSTAGGGAWQKELCGRSQGRSGWETAEQMPKAGVGSGKGKSLPSPADRWLRLCPCPEAVLSDSGGPDTRHPLPLQRGIGARAGQTREVEGGREAPPTALSPPPSQPYSPAQIEWGGEESGCTGSASPFWAPPPKNPFPATPLPETTSLANPVLPTAPSPLSSLWRQQQQLHPLPTEGPFLSGQEARARTASPPSMYRVCAGVPQQQQQNATRVRQDMVTKREMAHQRLGGE